MMMWIVLFPILITMSIAAKSKNEEYKEYCDLQKSEETLLQLAKKNMYLRIIINKYEFRPYEKWPKRKGFGERSTPSGSSNESLMYTILDKLYPNATYKKRKIIQFYKLVIRVDAYSDVDREADSFKGMAFYYDEFGDYDNANKNYTFTDKKQKIELVDNERVYTLEDKATLKISGWKKEIIDLNIEFLLGPKKKKIHNASSYYYKNETKKGKKDAFLVTPSLEMGYTEPIVYQIFMYLDNGTKGERNFQIEENNEVNKLIKSIIDSAGEKDADGSFEISSDERVINHLDGAFCKFLKPWIKSKDSKTVQIDLFGVARTLVKFPEYFLTQSISHGEGFGNGLKEFEFSPGKFRANNTASSYTQKLFKYVFNKFRKDIKEDMYTNEKWDEMAFLDNIHRTFVVLMQKAFKKHRKEKNNKFKFHTYDQHFDARVKQILHSKFDEDIVSENGKNGTLHLGYVTKCFVEECN